MKKLACASLVAIILFASCKKEPRTKTYPLRAYNNSGLTGQVSFMETKEKDSTIVRLEASGLTPNTVYLTHLHTGMPGNLTSTLIYFNNLQTPTNSVVRDEKWGETFDNAISSHTCFTVHNPAFFSNDTIGYVLAGNLGANAQ